jgi:MoxR-like ATPase
MNAVTSNTKTAKTSPKLAAVAAPNALAVLEAEINAAFPERRDVVRALLTAAVAGQHSVMLGPPGTAKSAIARVIAGAFQAKSYFELLMTRFTTPEEVFGPVKLSGLQQDRFARQLNGYLATAEVAFVDEVFKANSAILNSMLTILNEGVFHDDAKPVAVPLVTCIAASNELPEGPELDALYDRFLVRIVTDYIADRDTFRALLAGVASGTRPEVSATIDIRAEQVAAKAVAISDDTLDAIVNLREACKAGGIVVSDRRWVQCLALVRAAAHMDGRTSSEPDDLEVLESVLWRKPDERIAITRVIQTTINPAGARAVEELDAARELVAKLPAVGSVDAGRYMSLIGGASRDVGEILKRLAALPPGRKVNAAKLEVAAIKTDIGKRAMRAAGIDM